ncbi:MAG: hypothetical protein IKP76_00585 [Bacilli bacterium]|nr:hypothetical protein [Bacilli bacterium]
MSLISERNHEKKLSDYKINIKTLYSDGDKIVEKNSNNSRNDELTKGIRVEKDYFVNNKLSKKLYGFDPRIEYSYINSEDIGTDFDCPNCRMITHVTEKIESCPFCGSHLNLDYKNKDMGSKTTYDLAIVNKKYILYALITAVIISIIIAFFYFYNTGRTYNIYDVGKTVGIGLVSALILFFAFYMVDSLIVLLPIKLKKDKINKNDEKVWKDLDERQISYVTFYNNLHYELDKYYYVESKGDIIDYDVIDYYNFKLVEDASNLYLSMDIIVREVMYEKGKIKTKVNRLKTTFKKNNKPVIKTDDGKIHTINCHNCGASIDVTSEKCNYCDTPNNYNQEWYLSKIN